MARLLQQDASPLAVDGNNGAEVAVEVNAFEADEQDARANLRAMGGGVLAEGGVEWREATPKGIGQRVAEVGIDRREATLRGVGHQVVEQRGRRSGASGWSAEGSARRKQASRSENFCCEGHLGEELLGSANGLLDNGGGEVIVDVGFQGYQVG